MSDDPGDDQPDSSSEFERQADEAQMGLLTEFALFLRENKKWWLTPIILTLILFGFLVFLAGTTGLPWIYAVF